MDTLATRLVTARTEAGLTQTELARAAGLKNQSIVGSLESGYRKSSSYTPALAAVLGVNALWLADGRGPKYPPDRDAGHAQTLPLSLSPDAATKPGAGQSPVAQLAPRWPFPLVDENAYFALPADARDRVQHHLQVIIEGEARVAAATGKRSA